MPEGLVLQGSRPIRTVVRPPEFYTDLDAGIRFAVRVLHAAGIDTGQSCQGGAGHAYDCPTIDLCGHGVPGADGFAALRALVDYGLPVARVDYGWEISHGFPYDCFWRITFFKTMEDRADDTVMFVWGYQSGEQP